MADVLMQVMLKESPLEIMTFQKQIEDESDFGWLILNHQRRGVIDENGHFVSWPDEFIFQTQNFGTSIGDGVPFQPWWGVVYDANKNYPGAWEWMTIWEGQWFNDDTHAQQDIDTMKPINIRPSSDGGNLKRYYKKTMTDTHVQIVAFDCNHPEIASLFPYSEYPEYWTYPCAIDLNGKVTRIAGGIDVLCPQVCRPEQGLWARRENVTFLAHRPSAWGFADVLKTYSASDFS